jgi:hypothetical protein
MPEERAASELVEKAFALARQSGKPEWWAMAIPVLKNRLLMLTGNRFKEADYGATSFRDFLGKVEELITVEKHPPPGFVILKSAAPDHATKPIRAHHGERVRADLWRAVLDYTSGLTYVWDISQQTARPAEFNEQGLVLPTISLDELKSWRAEFVASHKSGNAEVAGVVESWREKGLPTAELPPAMRPIWNKYLKQKVQQRLKDWFETHSIEAPAIMERKEEPEMSDRHAEGLRDFILSCVRTMSREELLELRISPATAMRALRLQNSDQNER